MIYPLKLKPVYVEKIWGGDGLKRIFSRSLPYEKTGESLEIAETEIISNGIYKGIPFYEVLKKEPEKYLGKNILSENPFPLLLKLIDASSDLSIQVHPSNQYNEKNERHFIGKNEAWYILSAPENAKIIAGLKPGVPKEVLSKLAGSEKIRNVLNSIPVKKGDVINIPAGMVHAITKSIVLMEIQQNSDRTYRLYDYGRVWKDGKRELHINEALEAIDYNLPENKNPVKGLSIKEDGVLKTYYICNNHFSLIKYEFENYYTEESDIDKFFILTLAEGSGKIEYSDKAMELSPGESIFIPAALGKYMIRGKGIIIKTFIGHKEKDFLSPLLSYGYSMEEITEKTWVT